MTDEDIKERLEEIMDHQDSRDKKVDAMAQDITEIKGALLGSTYYKNGIISRIEALETGQEKLKANQRKEFVFRTKVAAIWSGCILGGGGVIWFLIDVLPKILSKS